VIDDAIAIGLSPDQRAESLSERQPARALARKIFDWTDQARFAHLSGDTNPIHMDVAAASRTGFIGPIVHGVHVVLWALEALPLDEDLAPSSIRASFLVPIHLGEAVAATLKHRSGSTFRLDITAGDAVAAVLMLNLPSGRRAPLAPGNHVHSADWPAFAIELGLEAMKSQRGAIRFAHPAECTAAVFPLVSRSISPGRVATMIALSRLVGMICPGRYSILKSFTLDFTERADDSGVLRYAMFDVNERFRVVRLGVSGPGTTGEVAAVVRHAQDHPAPEARDQGS